MTVLQSLARRDNTAAAGDAVAAGTAHGGVKVCSSITAVEPAAGSRTPPAQLAHRRCVASRFPFASPQVFGASTKRAWLLVGGEAGDGSLSLFATASGLTFVDTAF